jgi:hypothetical protein
LLILHHTFCSPRLQPWSPIIITTVVAFIGSNAANTYRGSADSGQWTVDSGKDHVHTIPLMCTIPFKSIRNTFPILASV